MKITKELMEHLKVISISLKKENTNILCFLERIEKEVWTFSVPVKPEISINEQISFEVLFDRKDTPCTLNSKVLEFGENWISIVPQTINISDRLKVFITVITEMQNKYESFGRRKEERVKIGKEKAKNFGLTALEQQLFLQGVKMIQPCVILDASVHGICVITPETPGIKNEENFCIKIQFQYPEKAIVLKAHRVYSRINKTEQKNFITLCCQLLEPIHFEWRERVIKMIENEQISS